MTFPRFTRCLALTVGLLLVTGRSASAGESSSCPPQAQLPSAQQLSAGTAHAQDHGFLWRLHREGHDSYLFGTVHVARFEWMFPGAALQRALRSVDMVALELDLADPVIRDQMTQALRAPSPPLPPPLQARLSRLLASECLPEHALDGLSPELQVDALSTLVGRRDGLDPQYGIDNYLSGWAHGAKLQVVSLETPELQARALRTQDPADMEVQLDTALQELESGSARSTLRRVAQIWADSDLASLNHYADWCDCMNTPAQRAEMVHLIDERNPALAESIAEWHHRGQRVLAAVGSLHMIGPLGLPALLRRQGFEVQQLRP